MGMYCNQCEQTAKGLACTVSGVCGKKPEVAMLQDILLYAVKGLSIYLNEAHNRGISVEQMNRFTLETLFATLTNVNFDPERFVNWIYTAVKYRQALQEKLNFSSNDPAAQFEPARELPELLEQGESIKQITDDRDPDIQSLQQLLLYGMKGIAAYAYHAQILGREDIRVYKFIHQALTIIGSGHNKVDELVEWVFKCGEINLLTMQLLDEANTGAYGHPVPTRVELGYKAGKCILVSGHDLKDLKDILEATEGTGIFVYTHGEMLPAHGYPELKKHGHLYGNYGTAWFNQKKEFAAFPGAILMTTNCIQEPAANYKGNIFTTGTVGWPGVTYVKNGDFGPVIEKAKSMPGFTEDLDGGSVMVGFAHNTLTQVADKIVDAINSGKLRRLLLVGGCDGARAARSYYTELVTKAPADTAILTLGCGKYRFYNKQLGEIEGIPRLLDMGQCNDAYSAIKVAMALSEACQCEVNDLPLSLVLSWYEQKAVAVLLTLLYLGIKDIRIGPTLPAFVSPNVLNLLVEKFGLKPIGDVEADLAAILQG